MLSKEAKKEVSPLSTSTLTTKKKSEPRGDDRGDGKKFLIKIRDRAARGEQISKASPFEGLHVDFFKWKVATRNRNAILGNFLSLFFFLSLSTLSNSRVFFSFRRGRGEGNCEAEEE